MWQILHIDVVHCHFHQIYVLVLRVRITTSVLPSPWWYWYLIRVICWSCLVGFYPLCLYLYKTVWSWSCFLFYKSCSSKLLLALCICCFLLWVITDSSPNPFLQNMAFMHCWFFKRVIHGLLKGKNSWTLKTHVWLCLNWGKLWVWNSWDRSWCWKNYEKSISVAIKQQIKLSVWLKYLFL